MSILVYTENWEGKFKKLSYELLSFAKALSEKYDCPVTALSIGEVARENLEELGKYGADKILDFNNPGSDHLINHRYAEIISKAAAKEEAKIVLFADNFTGKALAPRVSVLLKAGLAAGVVGLPQDTNPFLIKKKVFSGKAFATVKINTDIKILSLSRNSFGLSENPVAPKIESFEAELKAEADTKRTDVNKVSGKILLTDAEIVVSGGRGMKGPENWQPLEELASLLGAATACSRPVSDEGWRPHEEHTGQTGKIIAPNLYFAFGISGAIQHLAGVSSSKYIVAVNKDADAPVFEAADYGIVGDAMKVLPGMITAVKKLKSE